MYNILVLGVSGNVSQGILKTIRSSQIKCRIIGACVNSDTVGALWCDEFYQSPFADSDSFIPWVIDICEKKYIDILLTGVEENLLVLSRNIETLSSAVKTKIVVSDYDKLLIGQDKLLTCQWLAAHGFSYPLFAQADNSYAIEALLIEAGYPLIAKPVNGKGSKGVFVINNKGDLKNFPTSANYIVEQYIGTSDTEYTVGCYVNKNGCPVRPIVMQRWLSNGTTWKAKVISDKIIEDVCYKICAEFKPMGPMNIQLRLNENHRPVPFEFNVRFSGTTPMRSRFGFRDVEAVIREYVDDASTEDLFNIRQGLVYRYVNEVYDFADNPGLTIDTTLGG